MANRKYAMYEYKQILLHMREGESDREISRAGLIGRVKAKRFRKIAIKNNWLNSALPLPNDEDIDHVLEFRTPF